MLGENKNLNPEGANPVLMAMKGKRILMFQEGKDDMKIDTNFLKELTGGDSINGRALYGDTEEFDINGIVIISRNRPPKFNRVDPPLIRRNRTIACETECKYEITEKHHRLIRDDIDMTELKYSFFQLLIENYNPDMKRVLRRVLLKFKVIVGNSSKR